MIGTKILMEEQPKGRQFQGIVSGTPYPGTCMEVYPAVEPVGLNWKYRVFQPSSAGTDGMHRPIIVLLEKEDVGGAYNRAYVDGERGWFYMPAPGELLNMLVLDVSGTADTHAIGDVMIVQNGTGKLIKTWGTPGSEPFVCMETAAAPTADIWLLHLYTPT